MNLEKIRVVSLNTWKNGGQLKQRMRLIADGLLRMEPDIVLLQECFYCEETGEDTAKFLADKLGYGLCFAPARKKMRIHRGNEVLSYSGLAILSRFPIGDYWMAKLPSSEIGGERIALVSEIRIDKTCLGIGCIHYSHIRNEIETRRAQVDYTLKSMERMRNRFPCVLGGDFNCTPDSLELSDVFADDHEITNSLPQLGICQPTNPIPTTQERVGRQVDHLWVLNSRQRTRDWQLNVLDGGLCLDEPDYVTGLTPSDHAGVWADFALSRWKSF